MCEQRRHRKKSKATQQEEESDDEEEEQKVKDDIVGTGYSDHTVSCNSLRIDAVAKAVTNLPRNLVEQAFLDGRLRLNGFKITRKAEWVTPSDQFDLIKGRNRDNPELLDVTRMEVLSIPDSGLESAGKIKVRIRKFKQLVIPNYEEEPWQGTSLSEDA